MENAQVQQEIEAEIANEQSNLSRFKEWIATATTSTSENIKKVIKTDLEKWQHIPLHIALIGESGSGKSSMINAMLGLTADDEGAAKVGCKETTVECTRYRHPRHKNLVMWDLPGVGTPNFPKAKYLEAINFSKYNFFILISQSRFSEIDMWLAREIISKELKFYFVRTKIDNEIRNDRRAHPRTHNAEKLLGTIRRDCIDSLEKGGIKLPDVFLVNSHNQSQYDFESLQLKLIKDAPSRIKEALVLSFPAFSPGVIEEKKVMLQSRKWKVAALAALGSAIPIPGTGVACEVAAILAEGRFYCMQLGIDKESVENLAATVGIEAETLEVSWGITVLKHLLNPVNLATYLGGLGISEAGETVAKLILPIIGSVISVGVSYGFCVVALQNVLDTCVEQAIETRRRFDAWVKENLEDE